MRGGDTLKNIDSVFLREEGLERLVVVMYCPTILFMPVKNSFHLSADRKGISPEGRWW